MGNAISVVKELQCSLSDLPDMINDSYTVERSAGGVDPNWVISVSSGLDRSIQGPSASKHSMKDSGIWRIFMDNGEKNPELYRCGWRRINTIAPTRLSGDLEAIGEWRSKTIERLELLELKRVAENPESFLGSGIV